MQTMEAHMESEQHFDIRVGEKDTREMQDVLTRYMPSFYRRAYLQLGNTADAEDAVQDALLSAYKHLDQFKGQAQMSTWLTAIVTNSARMQLRRRPRYKHLSLDEPFGEDQEYCLAEKLTDYAPTPEEECRKSELHSRLMQFLAELSPSLRKVFQLRELDGLSTKEAAQVMGVADGTVKAQLARARAKLTKLMRRALDSRLRSTLTRAALPITASE
ncbi:MAG: sigma-24, subfamily [Acidobacteriaceae bacterium]|nr:sigma-24, subfamily [Acidobacteriaceae bacterium]